MSKKGLGLALSAIMIAMLALTGCGGSKATGESKSVESSETSGESKSEEANQSLL